MIRFLETNNTIATFNFIQFSYDSEILPSAHGRAKPITKKELKKIQESLFMLTKSQKSPRKKR